MQAETPAEHPLRSYRKRYDLSQDALASLAETTKATISRIESGTLDPTFALMRRLIAATNAEVTADMLIAWSPAAQPDVKPKPVREASAAT